MAVKNQRVAVYLRVATSAQADAGYAAERQKALADHYCKAHGLDVSHIYADVGFSGNTMDRPELRRLLADRGKYDMLVTPSVDRLARPYGKVVELLQDFNDAGVQVVGVRDGFDSKSADGKLLMNISAMLCAEAEEE